MRRCAVLGHPVAHSLSPALHRAAYAALGLPWTYTAVDLTAAELPGFLAGRDASWLGLSVTMPLKRAALRACLSVDPVAAQVGAVNTLTRTGAGWAGDNTDVPGLVRALRPALPAGTEGRPAALLGAGATAAAALAALAELGVRAVDCYARDPARAAALPPLAGALGLGLRVHPWAAATAGLSAPLVVATTPAGGTDRLVPAVAPAPGVLLDVLYQPWPTPLAAAWAAHGGVVVGGLELLVQQAVLQVRRWTGREVEAGVLRAAGEAARAAAGEAAQAAAERRTVSGPADAGPPDGRCG